MTAGTNPSLVSLRAKGRIRRGYDDIAGCQQAESASEGGAPVLWQ